MAGGALASSMAMAPSASAFIHSSAWPGASHTGMRSSRRANALPASLRSAGAIKRRAPSASESNCLLQPCCSGYYR